MVDAPQKHQSRRQTMLRLGWLALLMIAATVSTVTSQRVELHQSGDRVLAWDRVSITNPREGRGQSFIAPLPWPHLSSHESASAGRLFEDGQILGGANASHQQIRDLGMGRYSLWKDQIRFSSSDGTDVTTNGRSYELGQPAVWISRLGLASSVVMWILWVWLLVALAMSLLQLRTLAQRAIESRRVVALIVGDALVIASVCLGGLWYAAHLHASGDRVLFEQTTSIDVFQHELGHSFTAQLDHMQWDGQDGTSPAVVLENGIPLAHADAGHQAIRTLGAGRFSFWSDRVRFSTTDNTNPFRNGNHYAVRGPWPMPSWCVPTLRITTMITLLLAVVVVGVSRFRELVTRRPTWQQALRHAVAVSSLIVGFVIGGNLLRGVLPKPLGNLADAKRIYFTRAERPFDTVFLGTSRVYREIAPERFEQRLQAQGISCRAFNFGVSGMRALESRSVLRELLNEDKNHDLKWVFIETQPILWELSDSNLLNERMTRWHDTETLLDLAELYLSDPELDRRAKARAIGRRALAFSYRMSNLGIGSNAIQRWIEPGTSFEDRYESEMGPRGDGFYPLDIYLQTPTAKVSQPYVKRNEYYRESPKRFDGWVRQQTERLAAADTPSPVMLDLLADLSSMVKSHGATPIFFVGPALYPRHDLRVAEEQGVIEHLFRFHEPTEEPELHRFEVRFDGGHLNHEGALLLTDRIADRFIELLQQGVIEQ